MSDNYLDFPNGKLLIGDCLHRLKDLDDGSIDSVVTDPPYLISFMGNGWDSSDGIAGRPEVWAECLRVLKPGGYLLAFGATRTYHRMAVAIEDAGFEITDSLHWSYGQGFPKSLDVAKALDKRGGTVARFETFRDAVKQAMTENGVSRAQLQEALGNCMLGHYLTAGSQPAVPNLRDYQIIRDTVGLGDKWDAAFSAEAEREVVGKGASGTTALWSEGGMGNFDITAPATPAAQQWQGWGTALKPSHEPIVVARKPTDDEDDLNLEAPFIYQPKPSKKEKNAGLGDLPQKGKVSNGQSSESAGNAPGSVEDKFTTKPQANSHPTVKPVTLMAELISLTTPPGGTVLDPFLGSGTTAVAAVLNGYSWVGVEFTEEYVPIIKARIDHAYEQASTATEDEQIPGQLTIDSVE